MNFKFLPNFFGALINQKKLSLDFAMLQISFSWFKQAKKIFFFVVRNAKVWVRLKKTNKTGNEMKLLNRFKESLKHEVLALQTRNCQEKFLFQRFMFCNLIGLGFVTN